MGVRETLNRNSVPVSIVGILLVAFAGWVVFRTATDKGLTGKPPAQYYFTTDDGATLFAAPRTSVPPFVKDGKPAVLAHVFTCDKGKTQFVGYLAKYTDEFAKKAAAEAATPNANAQGGGLLTSPAATMATLVKKPGDKAWVPMTSGAGSDMSAIFCPSRDPWDLVEKYPE